MVTVSILGIVTGSAILLLGMVVSNIALAALGAIIGVAGSILLAIYDKPHWR